MKHQYLVTVGLWVELETDTPEALTTTAIRRVEDALRSVGLPLDDRADERGYMGRRGVIYTTFFDAEHADPCPCRPAEPTESETDQ